MRINIASKNRLLDLLLEMHRLREAIDSSSLLNTPHNGMQLHVFAPAPQHIKASTEDLAVCG